MTGNPSPGWYPDPSGVPGQFRYWDGSAWSAAIAPTPDGPPPPGAPTPDSSANASASTGPTEPTRSSGAGWWVAAVAAVLVLVVVLTFTVRTISGEGEKAKPKPSPAEVCPTQTMTDPTPLDHPADGRVHGGALSYPRLDAPWGSVTPESRLPFGFDVYGQAVLTQANYQPGMQWQASVLVGELSVGDGFVIPSEASEIVVKCIVGAFYGENKVDRQDVVNEAQDLDGHEGWYVESELSFDIRNLNTDGELLMVWIVRTGETSSSLFYASIPNDVRPELENDARRVMEQLQVAE